MAGYCEICGDELDTDDEDEGICKNCKKGDIEEKYESDEDFIDPAVT